MIRDVFWREGRGFSGAILNASSKLFKKVDASICVEILGGVVIGYVVMVWMTPMTVGWRDRNLPS